MVSLVDSICRLGRLLKDVVRDFDALSSMDCRSFHRLNNAFLTLLPKKEDPKSLGDHGPISLIHSFGKIFSKALANRFAPHLHEHISYNQNAFIKGCQIQDNFRYVLRTAKALGSMKIPRVMFKIDLA